MIIGVQLTQEDLRAVKKLFKVRWTATITNWKERETDYCMWSVSCPDKKNHHITETGNSLADTINALLAKVG